MDIYDRLTMIFEEEDDKKAGKQSVIDRLRTAYTSKYKEALEKLDKKEELTEPKKEKLLDLFKQQFKEASKKAQERYGGGAIASDPVKDRELKYYLGDKIHSKIARALTGKPQLRVRLADSLVALIQSDQHK